MKFGQGVVATDRYPIDAHLGKGAAAAGGHHPVGDAEGAQHPQGSGAVGAAGQHGDFHPGVAIRRCGLAPAARRVRADRCRFLQAWGGTGRVCLCRQPGAGTGRRCLVSFTPLQQPHQQIGPLLHQGAGLQVAAPNLAGSIGEAQVQVHSLGRDRALQGDDLQVALQDCGTGLARTLKGCLGEVAHHAEHEAAGVELHRQALQAAADVAARSEVEGNRAQGLELHGRRVSKLERQVRCP